MRKVWPLLIIVALFASIALPLASGADSQLEKYNRQIEQKKREKAEADRKARDAENRRREVVSQRLTTEKKLEEIYAQIDEAEEEVERLNGEIDEGELLLAETEQLLEEAIERIEARDELLKARMKFMYTNGSVTYLEVLMKATSFSDFLDRYNSLRSLIAQDREILAANIEDRDIVVTKKEEVIDLLNHLTDLYNEQQLQIANLMKKEKDAEVLIAELYKDEEILSEITEEQQRLAMQKIAETNALIKQRDDYVLVNYYKGGKLAYPLPQIYRISSEFGPRIHPITRRKSTHTGIDFAAPNGTAILAAESGKVITAEALSGYGNTVVIDHGSNIWTLYAHIRPNGIKVKVGDEVKRGDKIAEVGTTGTSTGYHLHFEVRKNGEAVNPRDYLNLK